MKRFDRFTVFLFCFLCRSTPSLNVSGEPNDKHRLRHLLRATSHITGQHKSKRLLQPQKLQPKISLIISTNEPAAMATAFDRLDNHLRLSTSTCDDDSLTSSFSFAVGHMRGADEAECEQVPATTYSNLMLKNPPVMPISRRRSLCRTYLSRVSPLERILKLLKTWNQL